MLEIEALSELNAVSLKSADCPAVAATTGFSPLIQLTIAIVNNFTSVVYTKQPLVSNL